MANESAVNASQPDTSPELPPASFSVLVTMLASQALVALGKIPDPVQNKPVVRTKLARHYIDTLEMLQKKTNGNLTTDETALMEQALHDLRLAYVSR